MGSNEGSNSLSLLLLILNLKTWRILERRKEICLRSQAEQVLLLRTLSVSSYIQKLSSSTPNWKATSSQPEKTILLTTSCYRQMNSSIVVGRTICWSSTDCRVHSPSIAKHFAVQQQITTTKNNNIHRIFIISGIIYHTSDRRHSKTTSKLDGTFRFRVRSKQDHWFLHSGFSPSFFTFLAGLDFGGGSSSSSPSSSLSPSISSSPFRRQKQIELQQSRQNSATRSHCSAASAPLRKRVQKMEASELLPLKSIAVLVTMFSDLPSTTRVLVSITSYRFLKSEVSSLKLKLNLKFREFPSNRSHLKFDSLLKASISQGSQINPEFQNTVCQQLGSGAGLDWDFYPALMQRSLLIFSPVAALAISS